MESNNGWLLVYLIGSVPLPYRALHSALSIERIAYSLLAFKRRAALGQKRPLSPNISAVAGIGVKRTLRG